MCIYLYKASIYNEGARSEVCYQGMTVAYSYNEALTNVQRYYTSCGEYLVAIHLEEQNECDCNCFELTDALYDFVHKHGELPTNDYKED